VRKNLAVVLDTEFEADEAVCVALALATEDLAVCFGHAPQQVVAVPTLGIVIHEACDERLPRHFGVVQNGASISRIVRFYAARKSAYPATFKGQHALTTGPLGDAR
jgi:hypothetical protein